MSSDQFIREVDEELQRDRWAHLWRRYGIYVIAAALLVVLATAGRVGWQAWTDRQQRLQGEAFARAEQALDEGDYATAAERFGEVAAEFGGGPAAVARLRRAMALIEAGEREAALEALERLAEGGAGDPLLHDLAGLLRVQLRIDEAPPAQLMDELEPLTDSGQPWRHTARELMALAALRAGDTERARDTLETIVDDSTTPASLRQRADELLRAIGPGDEAAAS